MPAHTTNSEYFSGQGMVYIADRADGLGGTPAGDPIGFRPVGNVSALTLAINVTAFEHKESMTGQRATDLRLTQETSGTLSATLESIDNENLALALYGDTASVTSGTSVAVTIPEAKLGKIMDLGYLSVSSVVVKDVTDLITYELDKNYRINEDGGSIYFFTAAEQTAAGAAASIAVDDEIHVTLDHTAAFEINALTQARPEKWLRFEGLNTASGNNSVVVDVFKFGIDPLQELALINEELGQAVLEGSILSDSTKITGSKFFRVRQLA